MIQNISISTCVAKDNKISSGHKSSKTEDNGLIKFFL